MYQYERIKKIIEIAIMMIVKFKISRNLNLLPVDSKVIKDRRFLDLDSSKQ